MQRPLTSVLYILIAIGTLAGLFAAYKRFSVEQHNKKVELTLDFTEVQTLSQIAGQPLEDVLKRFKAAQATSVAVTEDTPATLEQQGLVHTQDGSAPVSVAVADVDLLNRIKHGLASRGLKISDDPIDRYSTVFEVAPDPEEEVPDNQRPEGFAVHADWSAIRMMGVGLDPALVDLARKDGMDVVARIGNFPGASPITMRAVLADLKALGIRTVVFQGLEVLGYRGQYKEAAEALRENGIQFGQVEFGKQKGDESLGAIMNGEYVRVHSISEAEMSTLDERDAVDRFVRAARERNIRLCYIRLLTLVGSDPVGENVAYVSAISRATSRGGEMAFGQARNYGETGVGAAVFGVIGLGVGAGLVLLICRIVSLSESRAVLLLVVSAAGCALIAVVLGETGRKLVALLSALIYPTLACLRRDILEPGRAAREHISDSRNAMILAIKGLVTASSVTALGIVSVVGLMATRPFVLKATQFLGIKAAHAVPLVLILVAAIAGLPHLDKPWPVERAALRARLREFFSEPIRVGTLIAAILGIVVLAFIVARTGNEPGVGVSGVELKFRALLDRILPVRPRTKEFLLGHPAFVLALALWFRGRRKWVIPIFLVGVIGQVSILNTFCHAHTPLYLSFIRDISGLVIGAVIGLVLFVILEKLSVNPRAETVSAET